MRHLGSIALSIVLAPIIYVLAGVGTVKLYNAELGRAVRGHTDYGALAVGVLVMLVAGALYALLVQARISPLGPILAGALFLGDQVWALATPNGFGKAMDHGVFGVENALAAPALFGLLVLLAVPLLATVVSPRRWRRTAQPAVAPIGAAQSGYPAYPSSATSAYASSYSPPSYASPLYPGAPSAPLPPVPAYEPPVSGTPAPSSAPPTSGAPAHAAPADEESSATRQLYPPPSAFSPSP
jgi:hypothetical protein